MTAQEPSFGPLAGLKVIDIATIIAAPFAGSLLADMGADVIKCEMPGAGDALRGFPPFKDGKPLWWKVTNRGKHYATLDLRKPEGAELLKQLVAQSDVLLENFRPGTLEKWGLGPEALWAVNPKLVILRVSAFGQTGPQAPQGGFARIFEAMGGLTSIIGYPDRPPVHPGYPIADAIGGLFGAYAVLAALYGIKANGTSGEVIDLALTEAILRLLENLIVDYDQTGEVRGRYGNENQYSSPANVYLTADGRYVTTAGSTEKTFQANALAIDRPDLIDDPRFANNAQRLKHRAELDEAFTAWMDTHSQAEALDAFHATKGVIAPVYTVDQMFTDPQFAARGMIEAVPDEDFGSVRMQAVVPRLERNPGRIRWAAKDCGVDNDQVYRERLGLSDAQIAKLREAKVI